MTLVREAGETPVVPSACRRSPIVWMGDVPRPGTNRANPARLTKLAA